VWKEECIHGFGFSVGRFNYYFEGFLIIKIFENIFQGSKFYAVILIPNYKDEKYNTVRVFGDDLEVTKLKSLLKAKELGWGITDIKV